MMDKVREQEWCKPILPYLGRMVNIHTKVIGVGPLGALTESYGTSIHFFVPLATQGKTRSMPGRERNLRLCLVSHALGGPTAVRTLTKVLHVWRPRKVILIRRTPCSHDGLCVGREAQPLLEERYLHVSLTIRNNRVCRRTAVSVVGTFPDDESVCVGREALRASNTSFDVCRRALPLSSLGRSCCLRHKEGQVRSCATGASAARRRLCSSISPPW